MSRQDDRHEAMLAVFGELDNGLLHVLSHLPYRPTPLRPRRPRGRHGRVTVRFEAPTESEPVTRHEALKAAAQNEANWAWGRTHN